MKKTFITLLTLIAFSATVFAADIIEFATPKMGKVTFPHKKHQEMLKNCKKCHVKTPGKVEGGFSKEWAHKTCKGCHTDGKKGPTGCKDCHKK